MADENNKKQPLDEAEIPSLFDRLDLANVTILEDEEEVAVATPDAAPVADEKPDSKVVGVDEADAAPSATGTEIFDSLRAKEPDEPAEPAAEQDAEKTEMPNQPAKADAGKEKPADSAGLQARPPKPPKTAEQLAWEAVRRADFDRLVWKPWLWPVITLVCVCLVTSLLLGLTNSLTEPLIAANTVAAAQKARTALLPQADSFTEVPLTAGLENVTAIYAADNGAGHIVEAAAKGYGGKVPVMVAFDGNHNIVGVTFPENNETPGLGQKVRNADFAAQFDGRPNQAVTMDSIDKIASATVTTGAAVNAVNAAIGAYNIEILGVDKQPATPEEVNAFLLPDKILRGATLHADGVRPEAFVTDDGYMIIYGEAPGARENIVTAAIAVDPNLRVVNIWLDTSTQNPSYGGPISSNQAYLDSFIGYSAGSSTVPDAVAGATGSSNAVLQAVNNALAAAATMQSEGGAD